MAWHVGAKRIIRHAGIAWDELMPVFGVGTSSAVGHYLNGRRQPKPAQLKSLADYLGVRIDDFFAAEPSVSAHSSSIALRLRARTNNSSDTHPLGVRYDWSNPGDMNEQALIHKVLAGGRFKDILILSSQVGIERLDSVVMANTYLSSQPRLEQMLKNIREGFNQAKTHAA